MNFPKSLIVCTPNIQLSTLETSNGTNIGLPQFLGLYIAFKNKLFEYLKKISLNIFKIQLIMQENSIKIVTVSTFLFSVFKKVVCTCN